MNSSIDRRTFLRYSGAAAIAAASTGTGGRAFAAEKKETIRIGYVGVGGMGTAHVRNLIRIEGAEIVAVCDIVSDKVNNAQNLVEEAGFRRPDGYTRGPYDFKRLCDRDDLDLVYTATPWEWHTPVCVAAMERGKHAATEVGAAVTLEECWQLVDTAEKYDRHCIMMENCCYGRTELMVLNMVRKGLLGELVHCEGGYLHDLRGVKFDMKGEGLWRLQHSIDRNGNLYPTHGLGPVAQCLNINRGDRFDYLVSMSSPSKGLQLYAKEQFGANDPRALQEYKLGDVNTSIIKTVQGKTITVIHDCNLPRPYSRINLVQGTKGIFSGYPDRIHIEGRTEGHDWESIEDYREEYDHPLWKDVGDAAKGAGHGGMDYIEDYRLIKCLREGLPLDMDVYDAAAWSVVSALSEESVANRSKAVDFPDFTRGKWQTKKPLGIVRG